MSNYSNYSDYELERLLALTDQSLRQPTPNGPRQVVGPIDRVIAHVQAINAIRAEIDKRIAAKR